MLSNRTIKKLEGLRKCIENGNNASDLFKIMLTCEDLWMQAYVNIQSNQGAMTKGVDDSTVDGTSDERLRSIMLQLKEGQYVFKPSRRVYIPKANGKTRPLGIPTFRDKIVQEVCRILLEAIYEPTFSENSHGFRSGHSCHTALNRIQSLWNGSTWFVEFDIKGYFDNIDHEILINILEERISDKRFIKLIKYMLKAGYLEDWKWNATYSGTPQGGVISPILANIYLDKLDKYVEKRIEGFNKGKIKARTLEYKKLHSRRNVIKKSRDLRVRQLEEGVKKVKEGKLGKRGFHVRLVALTEEDRNDISLEVQKLTSEYKEITKKLRSMPHNDPNDPNFRRMNYIRYADDFLFGMTCSIKEAKELQEEITNFLKENLKLEVSPEKTGIKQSTNEGTRFLGYHVHKSKNRKVSRMRTKGGKFGKKRSGAVNIRLSVPVEKMRNFAKSYGNFDKHEALHRGALKDNTEIEIINQYNAEFRGFVNYYSLADNFKGELHKLQHIIKVSWFKTVAAKLQCSVNDVVKRYEVTNHDFVVKGGTKPIKFFQLKHAKKLDPKFPDLDKIQRHYVLETELEQRITANKCEVCDKMDGYFEVHHIRKLKDIAKGTSYWKRLMIARSRKTLVLCQECHDKLHVGTLPDMRYRDAG